MSADPERDAGGRDAPRVSPSLQDAATRLSSHAIGLVGTRVALAGVELAQARERLVVSLLVIGAAFGCGLVALLVATFGVIAWFWESARMTAIVVVALLYVVAAAVLWQRYATLRRDAPAILGATVDALRADAAALRGRRGDAEPAAPDRSR